MLIDCGIKGIVIINDSLNIYINFFINLVDGIYIDYGSLNCILIVLNGVVLGNIFVNLIVVFYNGKFILLVFFIFDDLIISYILYLGYKVDYDSSIFV